ncbi:hypothetical protein POX_c03629 [Penicillium oxalicum]|uniref:Uncharacterized protein n=1 Tax=Penicillium oxalicum (strain 114-2 / CGMCC 5302) TaxID=933388 RepID=S7Z974_PENO1|nr:hypothetical protein POX_c03629 [Penicillium oxalicum]EPS25226.1 hypothetical protein PDE_00158 [Penicillium oxalicum 114-2]KAI2790780.1 hypothetical protein POX_c03629 [Penicillium oxalicum]
MNLSRSYSTLSRARKGMRKMVLGSPIAATILTQLNGGQMCIGIGKRWDCYTWTLSRSDRTASTHLTAPHRDPDDHEDLLLCGLIFFSLNGSHRAKGKEQRYKLPCELHMSKASIQGNKVK